MAHWHDQWHTYFPLVEPIGSWIPPQTWQLIAEQQQQLQAQLPHARPCVIWDGDCEIWGAACQMPGTSMSGMPMAFQPLASAPGSSNSELLDAMESMNQDRRVQLYIN